MVKSSGELSTTAYLLSQADLIAGLELKPKEFSYAEYRSYQVPVRKIEQLTALSFGSLRQSDPLESEEALLSHKELKDLEDVRL